LVTFVLISQSLARKILCDCSISYQQHIYFCTPFPFPAPALHRRHSAQDSPCLMSVVSPGSDQLINGMYLEHIAGALQSFTTPVSARSKPRSSSLAPETAPVPRDH